MTGFRQPLALSILAAIGASLVACDGVPLEESGIGERASFYRRSYPDGTYVMTTFGGPGDAQNTTCGVWADGSTYYSTGVYGWGCNAKVRVKANGKCVILRVVDNGPAAWVESKAGSRCGVSRILDVSPKAARHLFGVSGAGWSDCRKIDVERVSSSLAAGPCSGSSGSGGTGASTSEITGVGEDCSVGGQDGTCRDANSASCDAGFRSGYCAGPSSVKCCPEPAPCTVGSQSGACLDSETVSCDSGFKSGYCPGASNIKCCLD